MIIYNITVSISPEIEEDWLDWMKNKHIPDVMATGVFLEQRICRIITDSVEEHGLNYAIQYTCESLEKLEKYQAEHAPRLQKEHADRYKDQYVAIRTLLEVV